MTPFFLNVTIGLCIILGYSLKIFISSALFKSCILNDSFHIFSCVLISFFGSTFILNATNLGRRLGLLVVGAATFGWLVIYSFLFILYAPRGPAPSSIDGLNALEIRIIPITYFAGSLILFIMFMLALNRYEQEEKDTEETNS